MPLITAPAVVTPPDTGSGDGGTPVPLPEIGLATATYTDPAGTVWPLTDTEAGWFTLADGTSGLGATPYTLTTDDHPRGGARLRHVQPQPRAIVWPLYVYGETHLEFVERWRALASAFTRTLRRNADGTRTPGVLEIARPDGTSRRIEVYYREGFEGRGTKGSGRIVDSAVLTLWCADPYWWDTEAVTVHREYGTAAADFLAPFPTVSSSQVLGATTVVNAGDVEVWPVWTITGPASSITFTRQDNGEAFTVNPSAVGHGALLAGQKVTVRTDPPQVRYQDGSNWIGALDWPGASLWSLPPGSTDVTFQLDGAGPGSAVDLTYHPRFETA
ncbi:phage tail protein [Streptomyces sp. NPDC006527]|uniref:phage tail protein n=1 Tax=Streptomyces sp. NPDC006527 TaxID=3364749 RepID=UPI003683174B